MKTMVGRMGNMLASGAAVGYLAKLHQRIDTKFHNLRTRAGPTPALAAQRGGTSNCDWVVAMACSGATPHRVRSFWRAINSW